MASINLTNYDNAIIMLKDFAGGNIKKFSDEGILRNIFVTNFIEALSKVQLESKEICNSINKITKNIVELNIPIIDLYNFFGIKKIKLDDLEYFFNNYFLTISNRKSQLQKIYLMTLKNTANDSSQAIGDIFSNIDLAYSPNKYVYIKPKIKYSYKTSKEAFISKIDAIKRLYADDLKNEIFSNFFKNINSAKFKNAELKSFVERLKSSYDSKNFELFKLNDVSLDNQLLIFIKNLNCDFFNDSSSFLELKQLFNKNAYFTNADKILNELCTIMYKQYISDLNKFENRDKEFNIDNYMVNIDIDPNFNILGNSQNFITYVFYTYVSRSDIGLNNIKSYISEIKILKEQLNNLINQIIEKEPRMEWGE